MMGFAFYQQNTAVLSKKADKNATVQQPARPIVKKESLLYSTPKAKDRKEKPSSSKVSTGPLAKPSQGSDVEPVK